MTRKFGEVFRNVPFEKKGPGSRFMKEFECCKRDFGSNSDSEYEFTLVMRDAEDSEYYDAEQGLVKMQRLVENLRFPDRAPVVLMTNSDDMEALFRPVVQKILEMLRQQLRQAQIEGGRQINV